MEIELGSRREIFLSHILTCLLLLIERADIPVGRGDSLHTSWRPNHES